MKLKVDKSQRYAKMRAHTATHLLHSELAKFFPNTKQAGSMVDDDSLRFDFVADRLLNPEEILEIEKKINQIIYLACDVTVEEMSINEAAKLWAKMFFEDKYGDVVRVVIVKNEKLKTKSEGEFISMEFCGGTHVDNTKDIWAFTIVSQEAVASGVKRISAITWPKVLEKMHEVQSLLDNTVQKLWIKTATQIWDRLDKVLKEYEEMKYKIEFYQEKEIKNWIQQDKSRMNDLFNIIVQVPVEWNFKTAVAMSRLMYKSQDMLICNQDWNFAIISSEKSSAKKIAENAWLKWWWNEYIVQWKDSSVIDIFNNAEQYAWPNLEVKSLSSTLAYNAGKQSLSSTTSSNVL